MKKRKRKNNAKILRLSQNNAKRLVSRRGHGGIPAGVPVGVLAVAPVVSRWLPGFCPGRGPAGIPAGVPAGVLAVAPVVSRWFPGLCQPLPRQFVSEVSIKMFADEFPDVMSQSSFASQTRDTMKDYIESLFEPAEDPPARARFSTTSHRRWNSIFDAK